MGGLLARKSPQAEPGFKITVFTGDRKGAGTNANVWIRLHDAEGRMSPVTSLSRTFKNVHEKGASCSFSAQRVPDFETLTKVELWRDDPWFSWFWSTSKWFVNRIEVEDVISDKQYVFPFHRWVPSEQHFFVSHYDCVLPPTDEHQQQRREELHKKRSSYRYTSNIDGGPNQSHYVPEEERFSDDYKWDIVSKTAKITIENTLINLNVPQWESMDDLKSVYQYSLGEPKCLAYWNEDRWFGLQRVQGVNPFMIKLCTEIPQKFDVTASMVEPFLEGLTLQEALDKKKIFISDVECVEGVKFQSSDENFWGSMALFFLNEREDLMPIAIQCRQHKGPSNPVFLPSDPPYTWLAAKIFYNNSDACYHQSCSHLGFTHLLMEGVCVCTNRNLSPSHPLFRLMAPHFLYLIAINELAVQKLLSPGGWVDQVLSVGVKGMFEIIRRGTDTWRLNVEGIPEKDFESKGVLSKKVLPWYPYRDDSIRIYNAIRRYVAKVVNYYYVTAEALENDYELHQWREELVKERHLDGVGLKGVRGEENSQFTTVDEVIDTVAAIINQCSVVHAAANFQQYEEYAFPPNYPAFLSGSPLTEKTELTEEDLVRLLPSKQVTLDTMKFAKLLSSKGTNSLGDFEVQYLYEPPAVQAADEFRKELKEIGEEIKARNSVKDIPYPYLEPEIVPNAISI